MIYQPITLNQLTLQNRLVLSPMCMYQSDNGFANDFHLVHYGKYALANLGLLMVEATAVVPEGRITHRCLGLWEDSLIASLKKITDFVHQHSSTKIGIQLAHAGRKASTWEGKQLAENQNPWRTVAPSALPYKPEDPLPHALTIPEIQSIITSFTHAATRAVEAGFDVIEIHAAHGYLLHQFLSPLSNTRTDEYGGNFKNRTRLLLQIVEAVKQSIPECMPLLVRISADEYAENGWDILQSIQLCQELKTRGVDLIDVSSGGNIHGAKISVFDGYQVPFSEAIRKEVQIPTGAVGKITTIEQANEILLQNKADVIFMARELLRNPTIFMQSLETQKAANIVHYSYLRGY